MKLFGLELIDVAVDPEANARDDCQEEDIQYCLKQRHHEALSRRFSEGFALGRALCTSLMWKVTTS